MLDYSFYEWIIESTNEIIFPLVNLLVRQRRERFTWFDCKFQSRQLGCKSRRLSNRVLQAISGFHSLFYTLSPKITELKSQTSWFFSRFPALNENPFIRSNSRYLGRRLSLREKPGAGQRGRFSKVPITNGPEKLLSFTLKIEVSAGLFVCL